MHMTSAALQLPDDSNAHVLDADHKPFQRSERPARVPRAQRRSPYDADMCERLLTVAEHELLERERRG